MVVATGVAGVLIVIDLVAVTEHPFMVYVYVKVMFSFARLVNKPVAETVALAPFETDQVPPEIIWLYWAVVLAQMVAGPVTSKLEIVLPTKLEEVPDLVKLVNVPFNALFALFVTVVIEVLFPPATP